MPDKEPFPGSGFDRGDFSPEERASHREMFNRTSETFPTVKSMHDISQGSAKIARVAAVVGALGAFVAYLAKQGFIG